MEELGWLEREQREIERQEEYGELIDTQLERFKEKFGREPGPEEPLFFDPDHPTPRPFNVKKIKAVLLAWMKESKFPPEFIQAFDRTGRMLSEDNEHLWTEEERADWDSAIDDYFRLKALADYCDKNRHEDTNDEP